MSAYKQEGMACDQKNKLHMNKKVSPKCSITSVCIKKTKIPTLGIKKMNMI